MKTLANVIKKWKILLIINLFLVSTLSFSANFEEYIEFNPALYEVKSREITSESTFLHFELPEETSKMTILLERNNSTYKIYILNFKSIYKLNSFWYNFVEELSSEFNSFLSTIPVFYGRYNGLLDVDVLYSWFIGIDKNMFVIIGPDKNIVEDLKYKVDKFR
jgi:hypothetical protein